jgi:ABC-2 type transport system permease protein
MKLSRLKAIAAKEVLQIRRDPRSLMLALLLPVMQILLLGYGVTLDVQHLPVCVYDAEGSQASQALLKRFQASRYFAITQMAQNEDQVVAGLDRGTCSLAVVVPADFSRSLAAGGRAELQAIADGTDSNTATLALGYAQAVVAGYSNDVQVRWLAAHGQSTTPVAPLTVQSRVWFNEDLDSRNFIIPGIVALIMALIGAQLTSLTISREWERGTMELLVSTPVTPGEVMLGKLLPYFVIGLFDAALCLVFAVFWFDVPFRGAISTLFFITVLFLMVVLGLGYLISVLIRSQLGASQIALLVTLLPTNLLSGLAFPIDQMPAPIRAITYLVYGRYYVTSLKAIFLKGAGITELARPVLIMLAYAAVVTWLAARGFKKKLV